MALMVTAGISLPRMCGRLFGIAIVADMRRPVIPLFAVLACSAATLAATPALAHPEPLGFRGFWGGVLHPLFVIDHVMAVLAPRLLIGSPQRLRWLPPIAVVVGMVGGGAVTMSRAGPRYA